MASTSSKNTPGDYAVEQRAYKEQIDYKTNIHYGIATPTLDAGAGLIQGKLPDIELSGNPNDIESQLFGIGSTNLVNEKPVTVPEFKSMSTVSFFDRPTVIMPQKMKTITGQRPFIA
jgi:hypothetical protein